MYIPEWPVGSLCAEEGGRPRRWPHGLRAEQDACFRHGHKWSCSLECYQRAPGHSVGQQTAWENWNVLKSQIKTTTVIEHFTECDSVTADLHVPGYEAPGTWRIWSLWSAGRVDLQICWWRTLGWDTWREAWRWETGSERQKYYVRDTW